MNMVSRELAFIFPQLSVMCFQLRQSEIEIQSPETLGDSINLRRTQRHEATARVLNRSSGPTIPER
jgi:hypothetical protein